MAVNRIYCATGLIGGNPGDLDTIDGADLADKDMCIVIDQTTTYFYALDADSALAESSPNIIAPDDNPGDKRWILQSLRAEDLTLSDDIILATDDVKIGDFLEVVGSVQIGDADGTGGNLTIYSDTAGDHIVFDKTLKTLTLTDIGLDTTSIGATTPGTIVGTTIDANTDFTVGNLVITDGVLTDTTGIQLAASVTVDDGSDAQQLLIGAGDTRRGTLTLTGHATGTTQGGTINIHTSADYDTTIDLFTVRVESDDLYIGPSTNMDALIYNGGTDRWQFTTSVTQFGVADTSAHVLQLLSGTAAGSTIQFIVPADYDTTIAQYQIDSDEDDLQIGTDVDPNMLVFTEGTSIVATVPVTGTTFDASTDFTVGGTVLSNAQLYDDGNLLINAATSTRIAGAGILYIGTEDNSSYGQLRLYGRETTQTQGGKITIDLAADHDTTITDFQIQGTSDDLTIGPSNDTDALKYDGTNTKWDFTAGNSSVDFNCNLILGDAVKIEWDNVPASDATMSGDIHSATVDANASGIGALMVLSSDGNWDEADASAAATIGCLGIAVESGTGTKDILRRGWVKDTAWTFTAGQQLFASETTGAITATAPTTSGSFVQVVGYAESATTIYFNPSVDYIEVA